MPAHDTAAAAARELLARRAARAGLLAFTCYTMPAYRPEPAHACIASALDWLATTRGARLMIIAPPQHGKTELTSVRLPAYWLGTRPNDPVILTSYAASLAYTASRSARECLEGPARRVFPSVHTHPASRAVDHWRLAPPNRGGLLAAGVGGPVTGHGAMLAIIDDPFENWEQAHSPTYRDRAWDWYRSTLRTRLWDGAALAMICTRWHTDDLAGRILADQPGVWRMLRLPALAETQEERDEHDNAAGVPTGQPDPLARAPGEPLCPQRFPLPNLLQTKRDVGAQAWTAQYQGRPTAAGGSMIQRAWLQVVDTDPAQVSPAIRYWDLAATESGSGPASAGVLMFRTSYGWHIRDVQHGWWGPAHRNEALRRTAETDGPTVRVYVEQEPGSAGVAVAADLTALLQGFRVSHDRPTGDKLTRLQPFVAACEARQITLSRGAWNNAYIDELTAIPNGPRMDQADASSGAFTALRTAGPLTQVLIARAPDPLEAMDNEPY